MATQVEINFVVDSIIDAGFDAASWATFLARAKLEMDYRAKESEIRQRQDLQVSDSDTHETALQALQGELQTIQEQIDAL